MTAYIVFRRTSVTGGIPTYQMVGRADAHDQKAAIAAAVACGDDPAGLDGETFAAVPSRGWREETVTVKTETRVAVGA